MERLSKLNEAMPASTPFFMAACRNIDVLVSQLRENHFEGVLADFSEELLERVVEFFVLVRTGNYGKAKAFSVENLPSIFVIPDDVPDGFQERGDELDDAFVGIMEALENLPSTAKNVCPIEREAVRVVAEKYARCMASMMCSLACYALHRDFNGNAVAQQILEAFMQANKAEEAAEYGEETDDFSEEERCLDELAERLAESVLRCGAKSCVFADFESNADFLALRETGNEVCLTEYRATRQLAAMILRERKVDATIFAIDTADYLRWLSATRRKNTEANQSKFAGISAQNKTDAGVS